MSNQLIIERLAAISSKTTRLIAENKLMEQTVNELRAELLGLKKINEIQKNSLEILEQKNKMTNIASIVSSMSEEEKNGIQKSISLQIKEIDKCLKLLKN
jgi:hypothetical protein